MLQHKHLINYDMIHLEALSCSRLFFSLFSSKSPMILLHCGWQLQAPEFLLFLKTPIQLGDSDLQNNFFFDVSEIRKVGKSCTYQWGVPRLSRIILYVCIHAVGRYV